MDKFTIEPFGDETGYTPEPNFSPDEQTAYNDTNYNYSNDYASYENIGYENAGYENTGYNENTYADSTYGNQGYGVSEYDTASYEGNDYTSGEYSDINYVNNDYGNTSYNSDAYANTSINTPEYDEPAKYTNFEDTELEELASVDTSSVTTKPLVKTTDSPKDSVSESLYTPLIPDSMASTGRPKSALSDGSPDDGELTAAERADIQRQKERARRKKLAARERRRKKRMQQAIIRCSILLLIVILLIVGLVALISGIVKGQKKKQKERELSEYYATSEITTEEPVANIDEAIVAKEIPTDRNAALAILQEQTASDTTMQSIYDSAAALPDIVLQNLAVNSEMKSFALNYPAMINIVFDGEFSVDVNANQVPLFLQFDERWGYADYSTDIIALRGAGPTSLSMAYIYLMKDNTKNPIKIADYATEMGYLDENGKTHWTLMTNGAKALGLKSEEINVDKDAMVEALEDGKLLICKVTAGDFTTEESFLVIREFKDGFFYVNDPNSTARSEVGWDFKRLRGQISKIAVLEAGEIPADNGTTGDDTGTTGDDVGTTGQGDGTSDGNTGQGNDSATSNSGTGQDTNNE
ncbi:MAG: hypothetical protein IJP29_02660 [Lachnospiraceae bacterium]|nr:hypothetical protein [Lachnospiraceae bacterium]